MKEWRWVIKWVLLLLACSMVWTMKCSAVQAAGVDLSIETDANPVVSGEIFYVMITITSTEELSGFEGHFTYDQGAMKYLTGGSVSSGNDDSFSISDTNRETTSHKLKYSIQFRARRAGNSTIVLKSPYGIYGGEDSRKLSVAYSPLHIRVLSKKEARRQEEEKAQLEDPDMTGQDPVGGMDGQEPEAGMDGQEPEAGMDGQELGAGMVGQEASDAPEIFSDLIPGEESDTINEKNEYTPNIGQSETAYAESQYNTQWKKGVSILVLILAVGGLFILASVFWWKWDQTDWKEDDYEAEVYGAGNNEEEGDREEEYEYEREPYERALEDEPGEELTEEEIQRRMESIEQRLEQKRQWLSKS